MGSILIRRVPDGVHKKFKQACRTRKVSMEEAIVRLIEREVGEARRGRPRKAGTATKKKPGRKPGRKAAARKTRAKK